MPARSAIEALVLESPLGIVQTDASHRVCWCNPTFERLFQYTEAESAGKVLEELIDHTATAARRKDGTTVYLDS